MKLGPPTLKNLSTSHDVISYVCRVGACVIALVCSLWLAAPSAHAEPVSGRAIVGGSWMEGTQSYFSVSLLGTGSLGWCLNHGAAEPLPGWYGFTAEKTRTGGDGSPDVWLEGSLEPVSYSPAQDISTTSAITFRAGTRNAWWDISVPQGCTLVKNGVRFAGGTAVRVLPDESMHLEVPNPAWLGGDVGNINLTGAAHGDASITETYSNIVITPPGAWDGHSYVNGLPAGYQRVGVGDITVHTPLVTDKNLEAGARLAATVRYYVDGDNSCIHSERLAIGQTFEPTRKASEIAAKKNCTPGLDAWYWEANYTNRVQPVVIMQDLNVYGRNLTTVKFVPAPPSALQYDTLAYDEASKDARQITLESLLPKTQIVPWGTNLPLRTMKYDTLFSHDGERWRTLRRPENGWYLSPTAFDSALNSLRVTQDTTVYDYWTRSTYDGVKDW